LCIAKQLLVVINALQPETCFHLEENLGKPEDDEEVYLSDLHLRTPPLST